MNAKYQPAVDMLAERRRTNGYADIFDLRKACDISPDDYKERENLDNTLRGLHASGRVAIVPPMGDSPAEYRLRA